MNILSSTATKKGSRRVQDKEAEEVIVVLDRLRKDIAAKQRDLDFATEDLIIDSCIYELKALFAKHKYYLNICKEKGLIANAFNL
jgi:hypothetical protein